MVVAEAYHVALLYLPVQAVLLSSLRPHHAAAGDGPAVLVEAEVLVEVGGRAGDPRGPLAALLDLDLPVRLVLQDGSAAPRRACTTQPQTVLHHDGLVAHGGGVQDDLGDPLAGGNVRDGSGPVCPFSVETVCDEGDTLTQHCDSQRPANIQDQSVYITDITHLAQNEDLKDKKFTEREASEPDPRHLRG